MNLPAPEEARALSDPTESQIFNAAKQDVWKATKVALTNNGFTIEKEEGDFIFATEPIAARNWSWDYTAGIYLFDESPGTRVSIVVNGAPDVFMPLTLGLSYVTQAAEAKQIRIQLFNSIRATILEGKVSQPRS